MHWIAGQCAVEFETAVESFAVAIAAVAIVAVVAVDHRLHSGVSGYCAGNHDRDRDYGTQMSSVCWTEGDSRICDRWRNCLGLLDRVLVRACGEEHGLVAGNDRSVVERRDL